MAYEFYISPTDITTAESNGIRKSTLEKRIRDMAWSKQRAITEHPQIRHRWGKWLKIAESNGVCNSTLHTRVVRDGWDIERAATTPPMTVKANCKRMGEMNRKYPKHYIETAKKNGISKDAFGDRVRRGLSFEEAATLPLKSKSSGKSVWTKYSFGRGVRV